jgi:hypothetical protein
MRDKRAQNLEIIDDLVQKSQYYFGPSLLPKQYVTGAPAAAREKRLAKQLVDRLQRAFPPDVLKFELGKPVESETGELPEAKGPTLFVEHSVAFSSGFVGLKRHGMYMGMTLAYRASFTIPKLEKEDLVLRIRLWRAPKTEMIDDLKQTPGDIYGTLLTDAYDTFAREFLESWFKKP